MMYFSSLPRSHHLILLVFLFLICSQNYEATPYAVVFSLLLLPFSRPDIALNALFSNTVSVCLSIKVRDQVSHLYKTRGKNYSFVYFHLQFLLKFI